jgi:hypothetical protein
MEENKLDASEFEFKDKVCTHEFQTILSKVTTCYKKMIASNQSIPINDENGIRDILLLGYLKNPEVKRELSLEDYLFDRETSENISTGRVDIRIMPINPFISDEAYYILECKRLDNQARRGVSGLNYKYIDNGIQRFTTGFYSSYYKINTMVGFIVEPLDIHSNVEDINYLLKNNFKHINTTDLLTKENFIDNFDFHYGSSHMSEDNHEIKLYHLMFDFASHPYTLPSRSKKPAHRPKLVKEYGCPNARTDRGNKARKHNTVYKTFGGKC